MDDEAGDGGRLLVRQVPVHGAVEVADRHRAVDIDRAVGLRRTPGTATSCSSVMSPTISSRMSSSVTRPITSPYSSTTSANGVLRRRNALSWSDSGRGVGHEPGRRAIAAMSSLVGVAVDRVQRAQQVLGVQDADDVLRLAAPERQRASPATASTALTMSSGGSSASTRDHLGAVDHHVGDRRARAGRAGRRTCRGRASPTPPSRCSRSTAPRSSSCADRIG